MPKMPWGCWRRIERLSPDRVSIQSVQSGKHIDIYDEEFRGARPFEFGLSPMGSPVAVAVLVVQTAAYDPRDVSDLMVTEGQNVFLLLRDGGVVRPCTALGGTMRLTDSVIEFEPDGAVGALVAPFRMPWREGRSFRAAPYRDCFVIGRAGALIRFAVRRLEMRLKGAQFAVNPAGMRCLSEYAMDVLGSYNAGVYFRPPFGLPHQVEALVAIDACISPRIAPCAPTKTVTFDGVVTFGRRFVVRVASTECGVPVCAELHTLRLNDSFETISDVDVRDGRLEFTNIEYGKRVSIGVTKLVMMYPRWAQPVVFEPPTTPRACWSLASIAASLLVYGPQALGHTVPAMVAWLTNPYLPAPEKAKIAPQ